MQILQVEMIVKNNFLALWIFFLHFGLVNLHRELNCNDGVYNCVTSTLSIDCTSQGKEQSNIASFQGRDGKTWAAGPEDNNLLSFPQLDH